MQSSPEFASEVLAPYPIKLRGSSLARWVLGLFGWTVEFDGLPTPQGVLVVYPHTSNWDFIVLILAKWSVGLRASFWGKDTLFRIPLFGRWLRWIGGEPVIRDAPRGVVGQAVDVFNEHKARGDFFWLGLSPEGTRKRTDGWRSGFYQTALQAGVPLGLAQLDFGKRKVVVRDFIRLTGEAATDMRRIADCFDGVRGQNPDNASPIQFADKQP
ncbi:MAG: 1-acyl-sn-glycerol-3-phosphate acyltransferase [Rhodoferax sp.]|nr:1-acyl-sn-glycerol-3-phosphate acyltransferase [Rhodoferax sp.]